VDLAGKLQLKPGQSVSVVNAPADAALELADHPIADRVDDADAVIVYCTNQAELGQLRDTVVAPARRDELTWVAYPKARRLGTDLTRDVLAELVREHGVQPVRQVSLDEVWSALRLRPA
jgi:phage-related baseplate assembly protein